MTDEQGQDTAIYPTDRTSEQRARLLDRIASEATQPIAVIRPE